MQHFNAVLQVTLCPVLHGSEKVQEKLCHIMRRLSFQTLNGMNHQAITSVLLGMALETTALSSAHLMYTVS